MEKYEDSRRTLSRWTVCSNGFWITTVRETKMGKTTYTGLYRTTEIKHEENKIIVTLGEVCK